MCHRCGRDWPLSEKVGDRTCCKKCRKVYVDRWRAKNKERQTSTEREYREKKGNAARRERRKCRVYELLRNAKQRALKRGLEYSITADDITPLPVKCPALGITLQDPQGGHTWASYSLDRVDPSKGYIPGNVRVISHRANTIKSNASIEEVEGVLSYMKAAVFVTSTLHPEAAKQTTPSV